MPNEKAIPAGYMTVGELAKKMNVTVRTLQYYDKEGLLCPSAESGGGRRLYADKDIVRLHQILSLKHLGFSLRDIKNRLDAMETPQEVARALAEQADALRAKVAALTESLRDLELLRQEVLQMQTVDFKKYADIIVNLQMKNEYYWLIKHFDDRMLDHIRLRFTRESGLAMLDAFNHLQSEAIRMRQAGVPPESEEAVALAKDFWALVQSFTQGDQEMLARLEELGKFEGADDAWKERQAAAIAYLQPALGAYFERQGIDPFQEGKQ